MPSRLATSAWGNSSTKRRYMIRRSRGVRWRIAWSSRSCSSTLSRFSSSRPRRSVSWRPSSSLGAGPVDSNGMVRCAGLASIASSTSSGGSSSSLAISFTDGWRPSFACNRCEATSARCIVSWRRRGTLTAQLLSRKYRLISPTMVGVAKVENSRPRCGSKRSIAASRPM